MGRGSWILVMLTTSSLLIGMTWLFSHRQQWLAEYYRGQLESVPDEQAPGMLRMTAQLGDSGIPVLVEALGSQRTAVSRAAGTELHGQLDRWTENGTQSLASCLLLAESLAKKMNGFDRHSRAKAAAIIFRLLKFPAGPSEGKTARLTLACQRLINRMMQSGDLTNMPKETYDLDDVRNLQPISDVLKLHPTPDLNATMEANQQAFQRVRSSPRPSGKAKKLASTKFDSPAGSVGSSRSPNLPDRQLDPPQSAGILRRKPIQRK